MAYGPRLDGVHRQCGRQVVKLLRGAKVTDIPSNSRPNSSGYQPENGQGVRCDNSANAAKPRRSSDRLMSPVGTYRKCTTKLSKSVARRIVLQNSGSGDSQTVIPLV